MQFIDHTSHIFSLPDYSTKPIGYEYDIKPYIFWLGPDNRRLSVEIPYLLPIRVLVDIEYSDIKDVEVLVEGSNFYKLLGSKQLQTLMNKNKSVFEVDIDEEEFTDSLSIDDIQIMGDAYWEGKQHLLLPFYVYGYSEEEGTFMTNILVHITYENGEEKWCPICVGGEFYDEIEPLVYNGANMGIELPKDILHAIYQSSFFGSNPDEALYNRKLKEVLMNYMHIRGECGNYESALDSLKWFGYGSHMNIARLLDNDNQFVDTYIHDKFEVVSDTLYSWKNFRNTSLISIWLNSNQEKEEIDWENWDEEFVGEGKPIMEDLMKKVVYDIYDEEDIKFWRPWYAWGVDEMYLKMAAVAYYWKKYFLPISTCIHSASIRTTTHINDVKYITKPSVNLVSPICKTWRHTNVRFQNSKFVYLYNQEHFMDSCYNEMSNYESLGKETSEEIIYINDICANIPIYFESDNDEEFFDCKILLTKGTSKIYESSFQFIQKKGELKYNSFVFIPKSLVKNYNRPYWVNQGYRLSVLCNGKWYYYDFILKVPEFQLNMGTLNYQYFNYSEIETIEPGDSRYVDTSLPEFDGLTDEEKKQINVLTTSKSMFTQLMKIHDGKDESITDVSNWNNKHDLPWVEFNSFMHVPQLVEVNDINFFDKLKYSIDAASDVTGGDSNFNQSGSNTGQTISINSYLEYLASKCYIYNCGFELDHLEWKRGLECVPIFMFNDGIEQYKDTLIDKSLFNYTLKKFNVDVLFDVDVNNNYYAKITFTKEDLANMSKENEGRIYCNDVERYSVSDNSLVNIRKELTDPNGNKIFTDANSPAYLPNGNIDWANSSDTWKKFYIDDHVMQTPTFTIRFAVTGTIETPSGKEWNFGGYKPDGEPRIFTDIIGNVYGYNNLSNKTCTIECNGAFKGLCKWRQPFDGTYKYLPKTDPAKGNDKIESIVSDNIKTTIDNLLNDSAYDMGVLNNDEYINRVHIFNLYLTKGKKDVIKEYFGGQIKPSKTKQLKYNDDVFGTKFIKGNVHGNWYQPQELVNLYKLFFENDGTCKINMETYNVYQYDFYLMHDDEYWFGVFISRMPKSFATDSSWLNMEDEIEFDTDDDFRFVLKRYRSNDRFLINRFMYEEATPKHHFNTDDLIVMTLDNVKFPFILDKTTKWEVKPLSLSSANTSKIVGNSNAAIISIPKIQNTLNKGYYDINIRYSVDGIVDHQQKKHTRILIS